MPPAASQTLTEQQWSEQPPFHTAHSKTLPHSEGREDLKRNMEKSEKHYSSGTGQGSSESTGGPGGRLGSEGFMSSDDDPQRESGGDGDPFRPKNSKRKVVDQRRRLNTKHCIEDLVQLVPSLAWTGKPKASVVLACTVEYLRNLHAELKVEENGGGEKVVQAGTGALTASSWEEQLTLNTPDIMMVLDPDGMMVHVSSSTDSLLQYSPEHLMGRNISALVYMEDHRALAAAVHMQSWRFALRLVARNKTVAWYNAASCPFTYENETFLTLTLRKATMKFFLDAPTHEPHPYREEMVSHHLSCGLTISVSPNIKELFATDVAEYVGVSMYMYVHPDDLSRVVQAHTSLVSTERTEHVYYRLLNKRTGQHGWVQTTMQAGPKTGAGGMQHLVFRTRKTDDLDVKILEEAEPCTAVTPVKARQLGVARLRDVWQAIEEENAALRTALGIMQAALAGQVHPAEPVNKVDPAVPANIITDARDSGHSSPLDGLNRQKNISPSARPVFQHPSQSAPEQDTRRHSQPPPWFHPPSNTDNTVGSSFPKQFCAPYSGPPTSSPHGLGHAVPSSERLPDGFRAHPPQTAFDGCWPPNESTYSSGISNSNSTTHLGPPTRSPSREPIRSLHPSVNGSNHESANMPYQRRESAPVVDPKYVRPPHGVYRDAEERWHAANQTRPMESRNGGPYGPGPGPFNGVDVAPYGDHHGYKPPAQGGWDADGDNPRRVEWREARDVRYQPYQAPYKRPSSFHQAYAQ